MTGDLSRAQPGELADPHRKGPTMNIETVEDFDKVLADGPYTSVGCYPLFFLCSDGETMSFAGAKEERERIAEAIAEHSSDGWRVVAYDVNWEDEDMICCVTNEPIECAYPSD